MTTVKFPFHVFLHSIFDNKSSVFSLLAVLFDLRLFTLICVRCTRFIFFQYYFTISLCFSKNWLQCCVKNLFVAIWIIIWNRKNRVRQVEQGNRKICSNNFHVWAGDEESRLKHSAHHKFKRRDVHLTWPNLFERYNELKRTPTVRLQMHTYSHDKTINTTWHTAGELNETTTTKNDDSKTFWDDQLLVTKQRLITHPNFKWAWNAEK